MAKKSTSLWLDPGVQRRLKILSAQHGAPVGDVIEALVSVYEIVSEAKEPVSARGIRALFESCLRDDPDTAFFSEEE